MPIYALPDADLETEGEGAFWIAPTAVVIGRVVLKRNASIWFGAVVRGDNEPIVIGENTNIQDGAVLHSDQGSPLTINGGVTVGHQAVLHGCTVEAGALIGIRATVLNDARIGAGALVGAHALVTERKSFPPAMLITGAPAQVVRPLTPEQQALLAASALRYVENWRRYAAGLVARGA